MTPKFHPLLISDVRRETKDTVSIAFDITDEFRQNYQFISGQNLTLKVLLDGEEVRRSYSLCSAPFENEWRVAVKKVENGKFSTFANTSLKSGMKLDVMTPTGGFLLEPNKSNSKSYVFFAAGSGITPVISIIKTVLREEPDSEVTLFYGNKKFTSIIFREEIEGLKNSYMDRIRVIHILSRENPGNLIQAGRIDKEKTGKLYDAFLKETDIDAVYICGPESMVFSVSETMTEKGVEKNKIHFELFNSPTQNKNTDIASKEQTKVESNVVIIIDEHKYELHLNSTGENLLDAAQSAGADLPFACKGGVCCTCKAKIIEGTVRMDVHYGLEQEEIDEGYILTCQSHPTSNKLVVTFDD